MKKLIIYSSLVLLSALLFGCPKNLITRDGPTYQAEVEAYVDYAAAVTPQLEAHLLELSTADRAACLELASAFIYGKAWIPYLAEKQLIAAGLKEATEPKTPEPTPPKPAAFCPKVSTEPAPDVSPSASEASEAAPPSEGAP